MVSRSIFIMFLLFFMSMSLFAGDEIDIPYSKHVLDNGLTVLIHEDHKAPIVAVNVWYHVGSKNEKFGKTGFAHLFEHLMFNGSENFDDDYFQAMERIGATDLNGTTNEDRTNYFQNVPSSALDIALWMESDRMGHLLGAITQEKLDEQRGVVQNEKRQGENQPYGRVYNLITENTYPKGHPYSWSVIGSMEDLDAASLDDVHEWFKSYYGPNNATVVIAGDVKTEDALARAKHFFGGIPASPPIDKHNTWIAKMTGSKRQVMQDRVPQSRIYMVWNVPPWGTEEMNQFDLLTDLLAAGKTSRLYKRLVYDDQIATDVRAFIDRKEISGQVMIYATTKPGEDLKNVEKAINEELTRLLKDGPTDKEVKRIQNRWMANFIRGIERIGGFGGKSDILAQNQVYGGSPDFYMKTIERVQKLTPQGLQKTAQKWLSDGVYILEVHPYPDYSVASTDVDRSKLPEAGTPPNASFPTLQKETLSNGLKIILAEWPSVPVVNFNLLVDAGYAADQFAAPGAARLAMDMLDEGTNKRTSLEISEELSGLGASLGSGSNLDMSTVSLSTLKSTLDEALDIYSDVILNPSFPENEFQRLQKQTLARIQREKKTPIQMALRVFPELLYGKDHAYGNPLTGSGTEATVAAMSRDDLAKFHQTWFKSNNATLVVVGATTMKEIKPKLENLFSDWDGGDVPKKNVATVDYQNKKRLFLIDRPGSLQSIIFAGHVAPPSANPEREAMRIANNILGGEFTARVNMNLREDKHWAYGAFTFMWSARGQRPFIAYAPVQTDKTVESMLEISKELTEFVGTRPATPDEFKKAKENEILALPGSWETMRAVSGSISEIVNYGLADDYYIRYPDKLKSLTLDQVNSAAKNMCKPENVVWVVVGDREKIEEGLRKAGFSDIQMMDSDGQPLTAN
jgi:zinc protease